MKRVHAAAIVSIVVLLMVFVYIYQIAENRQPSEEEATGLTLISPAFKDKGEIPRKYTCEGENISPPLSWDEVPIDTESFVLIMDDPDAPLGVFTHWVLFNLPVEIDNLPENLPQQEMLDNGGVQGQNSFGDIGYGGPCPPIGSSHLYRFHLYSLDIKLSLESDASKQDVLNALEGHVLDESELTGTYRR